MEPNLSKITTNQKKLLVLGVSGCSILCSILFCAIVLVLFRPESQASRQERAAEYVQAGDSYFFDEKDNDAAKKAYQEAIRLDPDNVNAYVGLGNVYDVEGSFKLALENYDKAIELDSTSAYAYYNRGITYQRQNQYELALGDFNAAYHHGIRSAQLFYNRAFVQDKTGKLDGAYADYLNFLELDRGDSEWTRYACDRVNWLAFWNADSIGQAFLGLLFQPCTRFPVTYTTDTQTYDGYEEPEKECYFLPPRGSQGADIVCQDVVR
ncbi:MAG: tetratricopeptide repeat protein [Anaerolineales bacterium]|nr:tetratricopeptide repeat protein [Anaerolineales bacterium]